jgi:hypothetical protein
LPNTPYELEVPEMMPRRSFLTLAAAAGGNDIFHIAIFRFAKENINDAMAAFRALASAGYQFDSGI